MRTSLTSGVLALSIVAAAPTAAPAQAPDPKCYVFLCFGQSNMEGFPGIEEQDKAEVERSKVLAAVDVPKLDRKKGNWYPAVPPCAGARPASARPITSVGPWSPSSPGTSRWAS
jgi:hypothetical protein